MNNNFSDQNCLTRYNSNALRVASGPDGQNIQGHTGVLINDKYMYVFVNANTCTFKKINKDNSYFNKNTRLSFHMGPNIGMDCPF